MKMSPSPQKNDDVDIDELERILLAGADEENDEIISSTNQTDNGEHSTETIELQKLLESATEVQEDAGNKQKLTSKMHENVETFNKKIMGVSEDFDSSDDEEIKNYLERKYNEYGQDINKKLKQQQEERKDIKMTAEVDKSLSFGFSSALMNSLNRNESQISLSSSFANKNLPEAKIKIDQNKNLSNVKKITTNNLNANVYTDPIFGMRIINPLISSSVLIQRMNGKKSVGICSVAFHIQRADLTQDWVVAGAIVSKSPVKTAKNGSSYSIWRISDLKGDIKFVSVFLFKSAHKELWKTAVGTVVAVLNPCVFDKKEQKGDKACFSIDKSAKVMIIGQSKDLGTCKAKKKNGDPCGAVVNLGECDFCIFHVQQEFGRMSKRSELQSATAGRGLNALRNKVLGKSEVFYGGQSYTAVPARKSIKQESKDQKRLMTLTDYFQSPKSNSNVNKSAEFVNKKEIPYNQLTAVQSKIATCVETNAKQRTKDLERLKALKGESGSDDFTNNKSQTAHLVPEKFRNKNFSFSLQKIPTLSKESFLIELNVNERKAELAKLKALEVIKKKPIERSNPNFVKYRGTRDGKKRAIDELVNDAKKMKLDKEKEEENSRKTRIQKMIEATSSHSNLIQAKENEQIEKYFYKMEKKEQLEEKMSQTYKVSCKAVICSKCKYTAFSAADRCKDEKHPIRVIDAEKRFFECQECGNRTTTVHKIPKLSCKNCQSSKWKRTSMMRERKTDDSLRNLSIRGDEEKFLGSSKPANLNLLVPEENV